MSLTRAVMIYFYAHSKQVDMGPVLHITEQDRAMGGGGEWIWMNVNDE